MPLPLFTPSGIRRSELVEELGVAVPEVLVGLSQAFDLAVVQVGSHVFRGFRSLVVSPVPNVMLAPASFVRRWIVWRPRLQPDALVVAHLGSLQLGQSQR